ncbi:MAG: hypothetical protein PHH84_00665 [Oscillospiraceae bacterium]|nr:hypothetical protein [Oscillospiraceae bacterium]MDD4413295.1 hypothetical protein [Oscillospiraceae bacterium]
MKTRRKKQFAVCLVFLICSMMLMSLTAYAESSKAPKGYVDPVSTLNMKSGDDWDSFYEFWERSDEIYLVPYEVYIQLFNSFLNSAENRRYYPVSGAPLILKRGEVIPEYKLDISYGPIQFTVGDHTRTASVSGEYIMKNIQFGTTKSKAIIHNVGGSYTMTHDYAGSPSTVSNDLVESIDYGSKYRLPEASYAAGHRIEADDPSTLLIIASGSRLTSDGKPASCITVHFRVVGVKLSAKAAAADNKETDTVDTRADKDKGETSTSIPEAVAIVIIGGATAIVGAGTGSGSDDSSKKKKSRYKMCLRKDFGDAIRYDTQPVTVYARIVEITPEGEEIDRPDLSARIEMFSGGGLKVQSTATAENYMGALVLAESVPGGQNPNSGVLSIRFSGEGGSFQNNVTFRLIGKPYISFPERGDYLTMTLPMLLGDGEVYETPVILNDFMEKPTSVRLDVAEGVPLSCKLEETENANETRYLLKVKNLSAKPETPQAVKQMFGIGILAENDKEKTEESVNAELYPEGLSIREVKFDDKGYVLIGAFDQETTDEWGDVVPTNFVLDFAVPEQRDDGKRIVRVLAPKDFSPDFGGLKGTDERTAHLAERFKYTIEDTQSNLKAYKFAPKEALVEEKGKPYYLTLPISCAYGQKEYTLDLPICLVGGGPGPLAGWDEAFANMKKIVSKVGGISPEVAKILRENGKKMSTAELRLVTFKICQDAVIYYTKDAAEYEQIVAELDTMIFYADWIKWFGDQAFSYLISTYYGNTADALLSPAKDIFAAFLGEVIDRLLNDEEINLDELEITKNITAGVDNLITNAFDDATSKESKLSFKQVCAVAAGFLVWKIGKNIYENMDEDGKIDVYSAITALTADLTAMGVKKIAGEFIDNALKNSSVQKALNYPISKWLQNIAPNVFKGRWDIDKQGEYVLKIVEFKQSKVIKKYLEELFGKGTAKIVEIDSEAVQSWRSYHGGGKSYVDLSAWPRISWISESTEQNGQKTASMISVDLNFEAVGKFFDYLFGELFGEVPFASETKSPPVDPPYIPKKSMDTL